MNFSVYSQNSPNGFDGFTANDDMSAWLGCYGDIRRFYSQSHHHLCVIPYQDANIDMLAEYEWVAGLLWKR